MKSPFRSMSRQKTTPKSTNKSTLSLLKRSSVNDSLNQSSDYALPNVSFEAVRLKRFSHQGHYPTLIKTPAKEQSFSTQSLLKGEYTNTNTRATERQSISFCGGYSKVTPKSMRTSALELARRSVCNILNSQKQLEDVYKSSALAMQEMIELCKARCEDNGIPHWEPHVNRFIDSCLNQCNDGKIVFQSVSDFGQFIQILDENWRSNVSGTWNHSLHKYKNIKPYTQQIQPLRFRCNRSLKRNSAITLLGSSETLLQQNLLHWCTASFQRTC